MKLEQLAPLEEDIEGQSCELKVDYCNNCKLVLKIVPWALDAVMLCSPTTYLNCPDCGTKLNGLSMGHDRYFGKLGSFSYLDSRLDQGLLQGESRKPERMTWSSESPLSWAAKDATTSSRLIVLSGKTARMRGHYECARAALSGKVVFLDGGNSFNASCLRDSVDSEKTDVVLDNIMISRAFNFHQMTNLVTEKLPQALQSYHPKTVAVFDPTLLYEEEDVIDEREAWDSFKKMAWSLRKFSWENRVQLFAVVSNLETKAGRLLRNISTTRDCDSESEPRGHPGDSLFPSQI